MRLAHGVAVIVCLAATGVPAHSGAWHAADHPGVRNAHALVYDESRQRVVMIGGADERRVRDDSWDWDGNARRWRRIEGPGPGPRTFPATAYDHARGETVVFGGNRVLFGREPSPDTFLGDTWILKGRAWSQRDVTGPPARAEAGMAYDRRRARTVLFGGYCYTENGRTRLGDTWEWDGREWTLRSRHGPPPRNGMGFAFDESRQRVIMFGGSGRSAETWEWDGVDWTPIEAGRVPPRFNPSMTYDVRAAALIRFGGWANDARTADTWLFRAGAWQLLTGPAPSARNHSAIAFDRLRNRTVLFGGHDGDFVFGDTWEWNTHGWRKINSVRPERRYDDGHLP